MGDLVVLGITAAIVTVTTYFISTAPAAALGSAVVMCAALLACIGYFWVTGDDL